MASVGQALPANATLVDLGGGTGANLEALGGRLADLRQAVLVDLCPSLLARAQDRITRNGWTNVRTQLADVTTLELPEAPVDAITFSYSLTMIPDWFRALERALLLLKPGGQIGVVDFYVPRKWAADGMRRQSALGRWFWRSWFATDNVFLSPDHLPWLQTHFETRKLVEGRGKVPYLLGLKAPYYIFVGQKSTTSEMSTQASAEISGRS